MPLRDAFNEHYLLEGTRRNELTSALSVPIAILSLVLGALAVIAKEIHTPLDPNAILQLALVVIGALACALCTYFLFRSLYGLAYAFVPTPVELSNYRDQLVAYHVSTGLSLLEAGAAAETEALDYLYGEYAKNAGRNSINNDIKSGFTHNANSALIAAVLVTAIAGLVHVFASVSSPPSIPKVEIMNAPLSVNLSASAPFLNASNPPPPPPPPPPAIVRPEPPPSKVIREHTTPPPPPLPPKR